MINELENKFKNINFICCFCKKIAKTSIDINRGLWFVYYSIFCQTCVKNIELNHYSVCNDIDIYGEGVDYEYCLSNGQNFINIKSSLEKNKRVFCLYYSNNKVYNKKIAIISVDKITKYINLLEKISLLK